MEKIFSERTKLKNVKVILYTNTKIVLRKTCLKFYVIFSTEKNKRIKNTSEQKLGSFGLETFITSINGLVLLVSYTNIIFSIFYSVLPLKVFWETV